MCTRLLVEIDGKGMLLLFIIKISGEGIHNGTSLKLWQLIEWGESSVQYFLLSHQSFVLSDFLKT